MLLLQPHCLGITYGGLHNAYDQELSILNKQRDMIEELVTSAEILRRNPLCNPQTFFAARRPFERLPRC